MAAQRVNAIEENSKNSETIHIGELKPLNEAIQRFHRPIPTADALITKLQGDFLVLPFGLNSAPEEFQKAMDEIYEDEDINPYFDDITLGSHLLWKNTADYVEHSYSVWIWDTNTERDFELAKQAIMKSPSLKYFNGNKAATVSVDTSKNGLGAVLLQGQPVAYGSVSLTQTQ
ncbi:retrovirus-related Pol polyprotein from transposon 17.6 [Trichonephila clavipes]|uniref:Retrovirus-related Pol polyprotein from transposon 17.6 n=1 Tax=Trichonephila clavipes TaxID=2585209 RepID=A0A8X6VLL4_TRICX|nr:retrovirus-related Pol polyprotein from transposon 17.6 [Trichonephila clavipes]